MSRRKHIPYSTEELAWIKKHCTLPRKEAHQQFCDKFDRDDVNYKNYNALCKRNGWFTGRTGRFDKGSISHNKGKKCLPGKMGNHPNARKTQFKKGQLPHNTKYVGHERVTKDGYVEISIAETNPHTGHNTRYVLKHKYLWEKANGKLPKGACLKCLDGNRQNTDPSNWKLISRGALPFLNGGYASNGHDYEKAPAEIKPTILAVAELKHRKGKISREKRI